MKKWILPVVLGALALISLIITFYIYSVMTHVPKGMQAAPNPTIAGIIQLIISAVSGGGFSIATVVTILISIFNQTSVSNPPPGPAPKGTELNQVIDDLKQAFPAWIADPSNKTKQFRLMGDLAQLGSQFDPDDETRAWIHQGIGIMNRRMFPPPPVSLGVNTPASALNTANVWPVAQSGGI